jgi:DNA repair protein RadC
MQMHDTFTLEERLARDAASGARLEDLVGVLLGDDAAPVVATTGRLWPLLDAPGRHDLALDTRVRLAALVELVRRLSREPRPAGRVIHGPADVAHEFAHLGALDHEQLHALALDVRHRVLGSRCLATGSIASVSVEPAEVLRFALESRAVALVLVHNHPSGSPAPSASDRHLTEELFSVARRIGLRALDHVIIGAGEAFSFTEERTFSF